MSDPFVVLGVPRDATDDQIKTAFRKLAMQYHPDRNPGDSAAEEKFKEINSAYEELKDPQKRSAAQAKNAGFHARYSFEFDDDGWMDGSAFDFEHIFQNIHRAQRPPRRNADVGVACGVTLHEAFTGVQKQISVKLPHGETRSVIINIPPGVDTGSRLRVPGIGDKTHSDLHPGDVYVTITVKDHSSFERIAQNLIKELKIDALDAILGTQVVIEGIDNKEIIVNIPAGSQSGQRLRVAGLGMPLLAAPHVRGDLILILTVTIPANIPDSVKALLEQARESLVKR